MNIPGKLVQTVGQNWFVFFLLSVASLLFAMEPLLLKNFNDVDPVVKAGLRALGAFLMLSLAFKRIPKLRLKMFFLLGVLAGILVNNCWLGSLTRIMVGPALVLFYSSMLWSVLIRRFVLGERLENLKLDSATVIAIFIVLVVALFPQSGVMELHPVGLVLGGLAGLFFSIFLVFLNYEQDQEKGDQWVFFDGLLLMQAGTFVLSLISLAVGSSAIPSLSSSVAMILDGVLLYGLGYLFILKSIKLIGVHITNAYIGATESFIAIALARQYLGEKVQVEIVVALLLIAVIVTARGICLALPQLKRKS